MENFKQGWRNAEYTLSINQNKFCREDFEEVTMMGATASLVAMWIFYIFLGLFPMVYTLIRGGKKK